MRSGRRWSPPARTFRFGRNRSGRSRPARTARLRRPARAARRQRLVEHVRRLLADRRRPPVPRGLLGRPAEVEGVVVLGDQRGGTLGFPTANLAVAPDLLVPALRHLRGVGPRAPRRGLDRHESALRRHGAAGRGLSCSTTRATSTAAASWSSCGSACATRPCSSREAELVAAIDDDVARTRRRPGLSSALPAPGGPVLPAVRKKCHKPASTWAWGSPSRSEASLALLESVRCLECGEIYSKPNAGGTVQKNPGCPTCGYVGWIPLEPAGGAASAAPLRRGSAAAPVRPIALTPPK